MKKNIIGAIVGNDEPEAFILHNLLDCTEHGTLRRMLTPVTIELIPPALYVKMEKAHAV